MVILKELGNILFIDRFPKIDLHGLTSDIAAVAVNDFILDQKKLKNEIIVIVHGIGNGILRRRVQEVLKKNKNVSDFCIYYSNNGCTIVRLKI